MHILILGLACLACKVDAQRLQTTTDASLSNFETHDNSLQHFANNQLNTLATLFLAFNQAAAFSHSSQTTRLIQSKRQYFAPVSQLYRSGPGLRCASARCTETSANKDATASSIQIEYGGIPHVRVLVGSSKDALRVYTEVFGMVDVTSSEKLDVPGAAVRIGQQVIQLLELPNPDPLDVDPEYSMSAPPPGYVAEGRPVHAGRDRHVAITLHDLAPLKAALEADNRPYTMSFSGRQALFTRDDFGNGWEFGPPTTYENATRLFPPYLAPDGPVAGRSLGWGGIPHVGLLVSNNEAARKFYVDILGMIDENDLRPLKLPFPGLFLRCGEQQVHILELPNPDPDTASERPDHGKDRSTAFSVKSLLPVKATLEANDIEYTTRKLVGGESALYCRDPDANELLFIEDPAIMPIAEAKDGPMQPWTRLW